MKAEIRHIGNGHFVKWMLLYSDIFPLRSDCKLIYRMYSGGSSIIKVTFQCSRSSFIHFLSSLVSKTKFAESELCPEKSLESHIPVAWPPWDSGYLTRTQNLPFSEALLMILLPTLGNAGMLDQLTEPLPVHLEQKYSPKFSQLPSRMAGPFSYSLWKPKIKVLRIDWCHHSPNKSIIHLLWQDPLTGTDPLE